MEIFLLCDKQARIDDAALEPADDVDHPFERGRKRLKISVGLEGFHGKDLFVCGDQVSDAGRKNGIDDVIGVALGEELAFQTSLEEFHQILPDLLFRTFQKGAQAGEALVEQRIQRKEVAFGQDDVDDAERLAAERIGIRCPGRHQADAEETAEGIRFVGDADDGPLVRFGEASAGRCRQVMLVDRPGHEGIFTGQQGIFTTHDSLKLRKFADHLGVQIRLCQHGGPVDPVCAGGCEAAGNPSGQFPEALNLVIGCPEKGMEGDPLEILHPPFQRNFLVRLEEEARIGKAGANHLFVSAFHHLGIPGQGIVDGDEVRKQRAFFIRHRKVLLVGDHCRDQNLGRKLQKFRVKIPADRRGIFGQEGDRFQQLLGREDTAADGRGCLL